MTTDPATASQPSAQDAKYRTSWSRPGSAERNSLPIAEALSPLLISTSTSSRKPVVLEVASGFGHQLYAVASRHPSIHFHPSEADTYPRTHIDSLTSNLPNVAKAESLDLLSQNDWTTLVHNVSSETPIAAGNDEGLFDGVIACNLTHITPWSVTQSLFSHLDPRLGYATQQGYRNVLRRDGWIAIYGAFNQNGKFTSEGNQNFDADMKSRNPEFGLRDVQNEIVPLAERHGFELNERIDMPAGNLFLIFRLRTE
ncbi:hypothetical protein NDA16_001685 [Ustilago loliicola]|nr:hypothetical protein NDA16_001685 [Ustilago loliicola]